MGKITVGKDVMLKVAGGRKMSLDNLPHAKLEGDHFVFESLADLQKLSDFLAVPINHFINENDLDNGVKVSRKDDAFARTIEKSGQKYYTYNHLATTKTEPNLMALRVVLHCDKPEKVVLNGGHQSKEIVYVTKGQVQMDWENDSKRNATVLNEGDSAYLSPGVSHSFIAVKGEAELIAVNY